MPEIKRSTATYVNVFMMKTDLSGGLTGVADPTVKIVKADGTVVTGGGLWREPSSTDMPGWYQYQVLAAEASINGSLGLLITKTGAKDARLNFTVVDVLRSDVNATITTINGKLDTGVAVAEASKTALVDAMWDEPRADHNTAGSTGYTLNNAIAYTNPWEADLTDYSGNQAGAVLARMLGGVGLKATSGTITIDGRPQVGVMVWLNTNVSDPNAGVISHTTTNTSGQWELHAGAGTYYLRKWLPGVIDTTEQVTL